MGDTSLSKNFNERASRTGEAFMILSSGNKAWVPSSLPCRAALSTDLPCCGPLPAPSRRASRERNASRRAQPARRPDLYSSEEKKRQGWRRRLGADLPLDDDAPSRPRPNVGLPESKARRERLMLHRKAHHSKRPTMSAGIAIGWAVLVAPLSSDAPWLRSRIETRYSRSCS